MKVNVKVLVSQTNRMLIDCSHLYLLGAELSTTGMNPKSPLVSQNSP